MKPTLVREFPSKLSSLEMACVVLLVLVVYLVFFIGGLNVLLQSIVKLDSKDRVWQSEGGLWDHPEPNYGIMPFVAEFFASITAVPLAGALLLFQALRFSYNGPVLMLFLLDCWMYTCAFFAHMLLWPLLNAVTLTSVLTNALYTFAIYSGLAGGPLRNPYFRVLTTVCLWIVIVGLVVVLPDWFGENGGVPALLTIQTPAVISALAGSMYCYSLNPEAFKLLSASGVLLCSAMGVSLVEVLVGKYFQERFFGVVPVFHIIIHSLEQVGIYLYGVGVAVIEHKMVRPVEFGHARMEYFWKRVPYFAITVREGVVVDSSPSPRRSSRLSKKLT